MTMPLHRLEVLLRLELRLEGVPRRAELNREGEGKAERQAKEEQNKGERSQHEAEFGSSSSSRPRRMNPQIPDAEACAKWWRR